MPAKLLSNKTRSAKKNSWKDVQSKARIRRRSKIALGILGLVIGLLFLSWAVRFTQNLFSPRQESAGQTKNYRWNGELNLNLVIRTPAIAVFSYNPKDGKVTIVDIPDETFLEVPRGFGSWQVRSIYGLGGDKLLTEALTSFLAIPIDGFLDLSSLQPPMSAVDVVQELRKNSFSGVNFLSVLKTDLTMWELMQLKLSLGAVRFDKIEELNLAKLNVLDKERLPDGTEVYTSDPVKLDSVLSDLIDPAIVSEHKTIAVFNATDQPQLANKWARLIANLGGNVIITANAKVKLDKTKVLGEQSLTLKRLRQVFGDLDCQNNPKCGKISALEEDLNSSRAQINLFVGEDFAVK